jgi:hypothetical protein
VSTYWGCWLAVALGSFAVPETWALATKHPENTFSWWVWHVERFMPGETPFWEWSALHVLVGGATFIALIWLALHLTFGIWR